MILKDTRVTHSFNQNEPDRLRKQWRTPTITKLPHNNTDGGKGAFFTETAVGSSKSIGPS